MPKPLPAGLSLVLFTGALMVWRTKEVPPHAKLGSLYLSVALARLSIADEAPTVSTVLNYLSLVLAIAAVWLWWRSRRRDTPQ